MLIEKKSVFLSDDPEKIRECLKENLPCIYLERPGSVPVYECRYVWQLTTEDNLPDDVYIEKVFKRHHHLPLTICETTRLWIRESVVEDLKELLVFYEEESSNSDVENLGDEPEVSFRKYIEYQYPFWEFGLWTVLLKQTGEIIGRVGLEGYQDAVELEYLIGRKYRGNGYAKEACDAVLSYTSHELEYDTVFLRTSGQNRISQKLAQNLGFELILKKKKAIDSKKVDWIFKKVIL